MTGPCLKKGRFCASWAAPCGLGRLCAWTASSEARFYERPVLPGGRNLVFEQEPSSDGRRSFSAGSAGTAPGVCRRRRAGLPLLRIRPLRKRCLRSWSSGSLPIFSVTFWKSSFYSPPFLLLPLCFMQYFRLLSQAGYFRCLYHSSRVGQNRDKNKFFLWQSAVMADDYRKSGKNVLQ